jgi:predicted glycoside hydrolase/deacetylase ChbG (UPF0249 family)
MDTISLIVRADDFGLCHAANQAIYEGFEAGILTCASLVVAAPWVAEAAGLIHEHPEWEVGLQLQLHCATTGSRWGPVAGAAAVPSLVDSHGAFPTHLPATASPEDITRELAAQADRARQWGITPAFLEFQGEMNSAVENALHGQGELLGVPFHMAGWGLQSILNADENQGFDPFTALGILGPGAHLWIVRPVHDSPESWALWPDHQQIQARTRDARAICDPEVMALIQKRGIELISFRQHVESRVGAEAEQE